MPGDHERHRQAAPEELVRQPRVHRARDGEHDRVVDDLHDRDAEGVHGQRDRDHRSEGHARSQQRPAGERIAEQERERHGERDGSPFGESGGRADDHPEDLADGAPGEAVEGGAQGHGVEGLFVVVVCVLVHAPDYIPPGVYGKSIGTYPSCKVSAPAGRVFMPPCRPVRISYGMQNDQEQHHRPTTPIRGDGRVHPARSGDLLRGDRRRRRPAGGKCPAAGDRGRVHRIRRGVSPCLRTL